MKYPSLSRAERLIRKVVEDPFVWLYGNSFDPYQLAKHLVQEYIEPSKDGKPPSRFEVFISQHQFELLEPNVSAVENQVADYIGLLSERLGVHFSEPIFVNLLPDSKLPEDKARIEIAPEAAPPVEIQTEIYTSHHNQSAYEDLLRVDAFLIIQGRRHVSLAMPITRIGRRIDNDIVIDAPTISRQHAQIRWRQRYFVLYDVSGQGRTTVNGTAVKEHILKPGDVIALSDVLLVYGEGLDDRVGKDFWPNDDDMASTLLRQEE
jgi:hypothetical protein